MLPYVFKGVVAESDKSQRSVVGGVRSDRVRKGTGPGVQRVGPLQGGEQDVFEVSGVCT